MTEERLRRELRRLLHQFAIPCFVVTHDRLEAMSLGDHMMVLERGAVLQSGLLNEVFSRPADTRVAEMVGIETVAAARVIRSDDGLVTLAVGEAKLIAVAPTTTIEDVYVCIRGEDVTIQKRPAEHTSARKPAGSTDHLADH
jgi:molybdate transport system ATP-binding protein